MTKIDEYKRKLISIDELLNKIKDNETIVVALGGAQPFGFFKFTS